MRLDRYRQAMARPGVRPLLIFGVLFRIPFLATSVVLTLHVAGTLGRSYGETGVLLTAATVAAALGQPWRGRVIDRRGLRRALFPALLATAAFSVLAPGLDYAGLLVLVAVVNLWPLPVFTAVRQSLSARAGAEHRRTAYALDAMGIELSFMIGPALGVWVATVWSTRTALVIVGVANLLAGAALLVYDPPTLPEGASGDLRSAATRLRWSTPLVVVLAAGAAATVVLAGTDVAIVAFAREHRQLGLTSAVFVAWSVGSIAGALVYGALPRKVPPLWLLAALGALTVPVGLAGDTRWLLLTILPAAAVCAPIITATSDAVAGLVEDDVLGEATGWHGAAMTGGTALGSPLAGFAMDRLGPWAGFATVGTAGMVLGAGGLLALGRRRAGGRDARRAEAAVGT
jgi:predicted MFS family arabinose efflux permease